ncbi:MAG: hypothetical protein E6I39_01105 [Chloroflexi bacterium]|nr:MAG: hypothetical protein E6I39_01105 [Chloroflexota bacterium]
MLVSFDGVDWIPFAAPTLTGLFAVAVSDLSHVEVAGSGANILGTSSVANIIGSLTPDCGSGSATSNPAARIASTTSQYSLTSSDGAHWQEMDATKLRVYCSPSSSHAVLLTGNSDLFTASAGFNQDIGIFVNDNGGPDQLVAWKESGGFAGTFSPNAAHVQALVQISAGHFYIFKLKWKTNRPAMGATIFAGAGSGPPYSPTSLLAKVFPTSVAPQEAVSSSQYHLAGSDGQTWRTIDLTNLAVTTSPGSDATAVLGANADLFTATAGYNQDLGVFVSDNGGPDNLVAWKESGGFAGTFSPNAAFVLATYPMSGGHTYVFSLKWKTNKSASGVTIFAGAGGGPPYSPTSLSVESVPTGVNPYSVASINQYALRGSDGVAWHVVDPSLQVTVTPTSDTNAVIGANIDLFTGSAGYNQDFGIVVSEDGGPSDLLAWKESGGFAGTFSPNAAFAQTEFHMTSGHTYVFTLVWKTNRSAPTSTIYAGAGGAAPFSPSRLIVDLAV